MLEIYNGMLQNNIKMKICGKLNDFENSEKL